MALKVDCTRLCIGVRKKTLVFAINSNGSDFRYVSYIPSKGVCFALSSYRRDAPLHGVGGIDTVRGLQDRLLHAGH